MSLFIKLTIKEVVRETPTTVSLVFNVPNEIRESFNFIAGQFITLKAEINGKEVRRAYSLSSSPKDLNIKVSIKKIADGSFSVHANENLKAGDTLEVMIPEGKFKLQPKITKNCNYMAFAAGSGITPIMSMIKTVLQEESNSKFVLIYGNKSKEETIFLEELNALKNENPNRLFIEFIYSKQTIEGALFGRINKSTVNFALKNKYKDISFNSFYICGPEAMIDVVKEVLKENKVNEATIHYELFTTSSVIKASSSGMSLINVIIDDEQTAVEGNKENTLLDNVLKADLDAPYSCKGGVCCSCICRVTEGEANMPVNNLLTDDEIADGLVLACQAYAVTDSIKIDFDDA